MMLPHVFTTLVGVFVAGATSGATGLAFPLVAGPVILTTYAPTEAVALMSLCSLTGQLFSICLLRRSVMYEYRRRLIIPGLVGVPAGNALLLHCDPSLIRFSFGVIIALAGGWGLAQPRFRIPLRDRSGGEVLVGLVGGLTAGLVGASAVAPAIWYALRGLSKKEQRAITQPFILTMQLASLVAIVARGKFDHSLPHDYALMLLPLLMGVGIGVACFRVVSSAVATRGVLMLVTASGLALLFA